MKKIVYVKLCLALSLSYTVATAQETEEVQTTTTTTTAAPASQQGEQEVDPGYNPNSLKNIHDSDIMYRKAVWRRMDLKEKQNTPFFAFGNELSKFIIENVKAGLLKPYNNDSLKTRMTPEDFAENLKMPGMDAPAPDAVEEEDNGWGAVEGKPKEKMVINNEFFPVDASVVELREDIIFDKKRSRLYYDIQSITLIVPGDKVATGLDRSLGTFAFKELVELFKQYPEKAIWFNPYNNREHKNYADAFELRLFKARITKVANPQNDDLQTIYPDPKSALIASEQMEHQLMEYEHNLWEY